MVDKDVTEHDNVTKRPSLKSSTSPSSTNPDGFVGLLNNILSWIVNFVSSLFTVLSSFLVIYLLYLNCTAKSCKFLSIPSLLPRSDEFLNAQVFLYVLVWFGLQAVLAALPIGAVRLL